jgi:fatty acid desaturase
MRTKKLGRSLNDPLLNARIHPLRFIDNHTNLVYLAIDLVTTTLVVGGTAALIHFRAELGMPWWALIPIVTVAIFLIGACQHRFAGIGHEASHYIFLKNRVLNELISDWFCMFPLLTTTELYRQMHLGHHEHANDWERDPEILNVAESRGMADFPMTPRQFFTRFGLALLWPPTIIRYNWDMLYVAALGNGIHTYQIPGTEPRYPGKSILNCRPATILGMAYLALMATVIGLIGFFGSAWQLALAPVALLTMAGLVIWRMPNEWFLRSKIRPVYSTKLGGLLRLSYFTLLQTIVSAVQLTTGQDIAVYFWLLWIVPLGTTFPYLMLIRDLVQHANADDGKLTNSRVVFCNPIVRWAMFVYGQDAHLTHHLYPAVPHYNLPKLHQLLKSENAEYAKYAVECHGLVIKRRPDAPTGIEVLQTPTCEPIEARDERSAQGVSLV